MLTTAWSESLLGNYLFSENLSTVHHIKCILHKYLQLIWKTSGQCGYLTKYKGNYAMSDYVVWFSYFVAGFPGTANSLPARKLVISKACLVGQENFKIFILISLSLADDRGAPCEFHFMNRICDQCWDCVQVKHHLWDPGVQRPNSGNFLAKTRNSLDILCESVWK